MDKEAREFLDRQFNAVDEKFEETKRHFGVVAEGHGTVGRKKGLVGFSGFQVRMG